LAWRTGESGAGLKWWLERMKQTAAYEVLAQGMMH